MRKIYLLILLLFANIAAAISQNVTYTSLYDNTAFNSRAIATSLAVGSTPGAGNVSGSGGASYSIPIAVPPGTNGIVPSVSIEYNSQGVSGIVGMGWNITGLSTITRVSRNVYYDGASGPVELSANDRFAMDGSRLIVKTGTYGAASSTYGTEAENFATVTAIGTSGAGPLSFEVLTKEGVKMEFGNTADSRFLDATGSTVMFWRLNRMRNPDGNYIDFVYDNTDRDSRISQIKYTGNDTPGNTLAPYNTIEFGYKIRQEASPGTFSDIRTVYEAGSSMVSKYLLDLITVKTEGVIIKKYQFGYGHDNINSYLKSVTEFGSDNSQLNPTVFKYGDTPAEITNGNTTIPGANIQAFLGDFDGDGKSEVLSAHESLTDKDIPYFDSFTVYKSNASGTDYTALSTQSLPNRYTIVNNVDIPNFKGFIPNDFTGDGIDDILVLNISANGTESKLDNVILYETTNGGVSFSTRTRQIQPNFYRIPSNQQFFYPGDFDGDGISEYISILGNASGSYQPFICNNYLVGGACGSLATSGSPNIPSSTWYTASRISTLDFNADGKTDLLVERNGLYEIFTIQGQAAIKLAGGTLPGNSALNFIGDFNGDGKTDLLYADNNFTGITKAISTGSTFAQTPFTLVQTWPVAAPSEINSQSNKFIIGDYNGDGRSDICFKWERNVTWPNPVEGKDIHLFWGTDIYYSQGDSFSHKQVDYHHEIYEGYGRPSTVAFINDAPIDINGDGRTDLVSWGGTVLSYQLLNKDGKENLLNKVSNGLNHVTEWNYKSLVANGTFYTKGAGTSAYPFNFIQPAAILVSDFKVPNGIGATSTVQYSYEEARLHRAGKGFIGFKFVYATDLAMGTKTVSENEFNTTYYVAVPKETSTYLSDNTPVSKTTLTNVFVGAGTNRFWVKTTDVAEVGTLEGRTNTTANIYDAYGNVTKSTVNVNSVETTVTDTQYGAFVTATLNRPTLVTITKTRSGETGSYSATTKMEYTAIGQLETKTDFFGLPKKVVTGYQYHPRGSLKKTTVTGYDGDAAMPSRSTTLELYDDYERFPKTIKNELDQVSSATYDFKWGKPLTVTGIDGLITTNTYDAFGRTLTTVFPGPYTRTQTYEWSLADGAIWKSKSSYSVPAGLPIQGKPETTAYFDLLGRQIKTQTKGFEGSDIIQTQTYDNKGNPKVSTEPHKTTETGYITTTNYYNDPYNRLTSTDNGPLGTTSFGYAYAGGVLTLSTTTPSGTSSKKTDAAGKAISATDNGGTLTYTYYNHGGLNEVKKDNVVLTKNEYDFYGRQSKLSDANAGVTTYIYDALGQLTNQLNANLKATTMAYNVLGQITSRTGAEGITSYIYCTNNGGGESKNMIKQVTGFTANNNTAYTYNALGQIQSMTETIDGTGHTTSYTYNNFGDVITTTYPSGLVITNEYNPNGYQKKIKNGSTDLYTTTAMNGQGQVTTYLKGTKPSVNTYENGFPTKFETTGIQNLNMVWDYQKGNLTSRNDARSTVNKTESFTYDNLDRLRTSSISGITGTFETTYDPNGNGNISTKTDAGTYSYHGTKFNAVTRVTNPSPVPIPFMQQDITYTAFMQPETVKENNSVNILQELTYTYGADYERIKGVFKSGTNTVNTRFYFAGGFEKEVIGSMTRYVQYIASPVGLAAIVINSGSSASDVHYAYTDHLGSIVTVTSSDGTVMEAQQSFDAWGRRRTFDTWTLLAPTATLSGIPDWLYRGYTGHEHLDQFGLINMNGRMYDPVLGRVLSPDNYVQNAFATQDYNRYSYARNNPLLYTDPDGNNPIIGAIIGAVSYTLGVAFSDGGFKNWDWFGFASSVVIGAMTSGFASEIGGAVSAGVTSGSLSPFAAGAIQVGAYGAWGGATSYFSSLGASGSFLSGALTGAAGSAMGSLTNGLRPALQIGSSAAFGGIVAELSGGNFWNGAAQGGIIAGFNHAAHRILDDPAYDYNGKTYTSKAEVYAAILADQSMEQFGINDLIALGGAVSGMELVDKRFVAPGASKKTSILSKNLRKLDLGTFKKAKWAPTLNNALSKTISKAAFIGRWVPWISAAMLAYDTGMVLYNTQLIYNKITANGR